MFRLLSKESTIFSVPAYLGIVAVILTVFLIPNFGIYSAVCTLIALAGIGLGYFCVHALGITYDTHLPYFLYTLFIVSFYPLQMTPGIAVSLLANSVIVYCLSHMKQFSSGALYITLGSISMANFLFLPTLWPQMVFLLIHIAFTSTAILKNMMRFFLGIGLTALCYGGLAYFFGANSWDSAYWPFEGFYTLASYDRLFLLAPCALFLLYAIANHFYHYNKKSPVSRFRYTFLLLYFFTQLITLILYMGNNYAYLLLLALPSAVIISRGLRFMTKYWMSELCLLILTLSCLAFRFQPLLFNTFTL